MQSLKYKLLENEESFGHWDCVNRPMRGQQPIPLHKAHSSEPKQQQRSMKQAVPPSPAPERCAGCHGEQPCTPRAGRRRRGGKSFVSLSPNGGLHSEHPRLNRGCTWLGFSRNSRTHGSKTEGFGRSDSVLKCPDTHHLDFPAVENFQQRFHHHHHPSPARHSPGARRACSCAPAGSPNPPPAPPGAALSSFPLSRGPRWNFQHRHPPTNSGIVRGDGRSRRSHTAMGNAFWNGTERCLGGTAAPRHVPPTLRERGAAAAKGTEFSRSRAELAAGSFGGWLRHPHRKAMGSERHRSRAHRPPRDSAAPSRPHPLRSSPRYSQPQPGARVPRRGPGARSLRGRRRGLPAPGARRPPAPPRKIRLLRGAAPGTKAAALGRVPVRVRAALRGGGARGGAAPGGGGVRGRAHPAERCGDAERRGDE